MENSPCGAINIYQIDEFPLCCPFHYRFFDIFFFFSLNLHNVLVFYIARRSVSSMNFQKKKPVAINLTGKQRRYTRANGTLNAISRGKREKET